MIFLGLTASFGSQNRRKIDNNSIVEGFGGPRRSQDAPKPPKTTPRRHQEFIVEGLGGPRRSQEVPRRLQDAPKTRRDGARSRPGGVKIEEKWSSQAKTLPRSIWIRFWMDFGNDLGGFSMDFGSNLCWRVKKSDKAEPLRERRFPFHVESGLCWGWFCEPRRRSWHYVFQVFRVSSAPKMSL